MTMIQCTSPCFYEKEGECTLTHVTSISNVQDQGCVYFKDKKEGTEKRK
ncbi:hypothetical protein [Alkaliphilus oremlandii]|nr:hypothetical protein [Alkaliphilus oremlandii]